MVDVICCFMLSQISDPHSELISFTYWVYDIYICLYMYGYIWREYLTHHG